MCIVMSTVLCWVIGFIEEYFDKFSVLFDSFCFFQYFLVGFGFKLYLPYSTFLSVHTLISVHPGFLKLGNPDSNFLSTSVGRWQ